MPFVRQPLVATVVGGVLVLACSGNGTPRGGEGQRCGGNAFIWCDPGLHCNQFDVCVSEQTGTRSDSGVPTARPVPGSRRQCEACSAPQDCVNGLTCYAGTCQVCTGGCGGVGACFDAGSDGATDAAVGD